MTDERACSLFTLLDKNIPSEQMLLREQSSLTNVNCDGEVLRCNGHIDLPAGSLLNMIYRYVSPPYSLKLNFSRTRAPT